MRQSKLHNRRAEGAPIDLAFLLILMKRRKEHRHIRWRLKAIVPDRRRSLDRRIDGRAVACAEILAS
jgi:hypothetical protein